MRALFAVAGTVFVSGLAIGSLTGFAANSEGSLEEPVAAYDIADENLAYQIGVIDAASSVCTAYPMPEGWKALHDNNIDAIVRDVNLRLSFERGRNFLVFSVSFNSGACEALMVGKPSPD